MDLKSEDIFNIHIDSSIVLSYEFDLKLNLDNPEEISKNSDSENIILSENKIAESSNSNEKYTLELNTTEDKLYMPELKFKVHSRRQSQKKDINGNEEPSSCENLNRLFDKLELSGNCKEEISDSDNGKIELSKPENGEVKLSVSDNGKVELFDFDDIKVKLSDSDNEANKDCYNLKERAPVKTQSRIKRNRDQSNILYKTKSPDKSQFNPEKLKFLAGSSQIEFNEPNIADYRAQTVHSPESGYESSSAQSGSSSPPLLHLSVPYYLDYVPETVDEQNILEFLVENTADCALTNHNPSSCKSDITDAKGKIIEIINYLKDIPDGSESSNDVTFPKNTQEYVPLISDTQKVNIPLSYNYISKNAETPKRLVYKLNDKAKRTLREFLSLDEFYSAKAKIYRRISEATNCDDIKVICVEDETGKASENRTNLHYAVLDSKIEDIYCLVEIHKQYNKPLTDINIRDKYGKTALDYAIQSKMTLVVDYLKENTACQSVNI